MSQRRWILNVAVLVIAIVLFFALSLLHGSVEIPARAVAGILLGEPSSMSAWQYIVLQTRLPQAITALLAGGALAVSGLLLQTVFHNPLAAPDVFGVTSGASLAVALVTLSPVAMLPSTLSALSSVVAAFAGAMVVTALIWAASRMVRNSVMVIILGMMVGYVASSAITLLNFFASEQGVKVFSVWGMGSFGGVSMDEMPLFACLTIATTAVSLLFAKPLNALLMGESYANNLGVKVQRMRDLLLLLTGLLTAVVTAYCGPIAFLALAVPHIARLMTGTSDHRRLLPVTILCGGAIALLCNIFTTMPGSGEVLPLNAITPLIGAPVIVYVVLGKRH